MTPVNSTNLFLLECFDEDEFLEAGQTKVPVAFQLSISCFAGTWCTIFCLL